MGRESKDARVLEHQERLLRMVVDAFNPGQPFGYQELEPTPAGLRPLDKAGLLDGAAGVGCALLGTISPEPQIWDTAFLLG